MAKRKIIIKPAIKAFKINFSVNSLSPKSPLRVNDIISYMLGINNIARIIKPKIPSLMGNSALFEISFMFSPSSTVASKGSSTARDTKNLLPGLLDFIETLKSYNFSYLKLIGRFLLKFF